MTNNESTEAYFRARGAELKVERVHDSTDYCYPSYPLIYEQYQWWMGRVGWISEPWKRLIEDRHGKIKKKELKPIQQLKFTLNILDSYPDFREHVLEVMEGEGFQFTTRLGWWVWWKESYGAGKLVEYTDPIKNSNILHAATKAATRYFEEKKR